ncbi:MAG TPA: GNAT family N-acetyltransferase [Longimicrobiaceae bacterium]
MTLTPLDAPRVRLRRFTRADLPAFVAYRADPEVARYQSWDSFTEADGEAFLAKQLGLDPGVPGTWFQFAVEAKDTGALLGDCALHVQADEPRIAEVGFTLAREHQGRGFGREAVERLLDFCFGQLKLHRVIAVVDCENAAAVALLERVGMRREGHFLENVWFKGRWGDEYLYALLAREWRERPHRNASRDPW